MMTISGDKVLSPTTFMAEALKAKNLPVIVLPVSAEVSLYTRLSKFVYSNTGKNVAMMLTFNLHLSIGVPPLITSLAFSILTHLSNFAQINTPFRFASIFFTFTTPDWFLHSNLVVS